MKITDEEIEEITEQAITSLERNHKFLISYKSMQLKYDANGDFDVVYFQDVSFDTTYYGTLMIPNWCFDLQTDYIETNVGFRAPKNIVSERTLRILRVAWWIYYIATKFLKKK